MMHASLVVPAQAELTRFFLVFARCIAILCFLPIFSSKQLPFQIRFAMSGILAFFISRSLPEIVPLTSMVPFIGALLSQVTIGACFGFTASFIFAGIQFAGELIDTQVGFAIINVINPLTGASVSVLGQLELMLASLLFLLTDSHLMVIEGVAQSFQILPLPYAALNPALLTNLVGFFGAALMIIFKIAAPVAVALLITDVAVGLLARVAPQVNVFIVALPAQLGIGLIMFICALPIFGYVVPQAFAGLPAQLDATMRSMRTR
jgi:flagellar biosynthetic protein FliR